MRRVQRDLLSSPPVPDAPFFPSFVSGSLFLTSPPPAFSVSPIMCVCVCNVSVCVLTCGASYCQRGLSVQDTFPVNCAGIAVFLHSWVLFITTPHLIKGNVSSLTFHFFLQDLCGTFLAFRL